MKNKILAVIPARAGSKSVPNKNIREIAGKPLIAYSIEHALESNMINRVIVSTDSEQYADIAKYYGAEVPFLRPAEYATDTALDYDVFFHALTWMKEQENYEPDIVVQLRPTYPVRRVEDIDAMIKMLLDHPEADSVRSMAKAAEIPYKMWCLAEQESVKKQTDDNTGCGEQKTKVQGQRILPLMTDIPECYNMPRQQLPQVYYQNACIDVFRPRVVLEQHSMSGDYILGYEMSENYDIDTEEDMEKAIQAMKGE
ncbi:MAG: acylneuraminate cytidylyltransferase family protein [Lachnospiraceae bacterium]|nr:acylneuraminate cytidylyltransferase family protein [Lachnospiraceae bacterium]